MISTHPKFELHVFPITDPKPYIDNKGRQRVASFILRCLNCHDWMAICREMILGKESIICMKCRSHYEIRDGMLEFIGTSLTNVS